MVSFLSCDKFRKHLLPTLSYEPLHHLMSPSCGLCTLFHILRSLSYLPKLQRQVIVVYAKLAVQQLILEVSLCSLKA